MTYGAVEIGGTKTLVAVGTQPGDLSEPTRIPTTNPEQTLGEVVSYLEGVEVEAVGISSFGPLDLLVDSPGFGSIIATPKPGWSNTPVRDIVARATGVPVGIETDVNGAALGEGKWGAARGLSDYFYLTVGTGIGGGAVVGGSLLRGRGHPEMGHVVVSRIPGDDFPGRCPFHGDCLEGMASGPALEDRFGPPDDRDNEDALNLAISYIAQGLRNHVYSLMPERIVVGGGVTHMNGFHTLLQHRLLAELAYYPADPGEGYVVEPGLGDRSGLVGALLVARRSGAR